MAIMFYLFCALIVGITSYHCYKLNYVTLRVDENFHAGRVFFFLFAVIIISVIGAFDNLHALWLIPGYLVSVFILTMASILLLKRK